MQVSTTPGKRISFLLLEIAAAPPGGEEQIVEAAHAGLGPDRAVGGTQGIQTGEDILNYCGPVVEKSATYAFVFRFHLFTSRPIKPICATAEHADDRRETHCMSALLCPDALPL